MKYLYLWNDIPLFFNTGLSQIDFLLRNFINKLNESDECTYEYINHQLFNQWHQILKKIKANTVLTLGTRPHLLSYGKNTSKCNIKSERKINKQGFTIGVDFKQNSGDIFLAHITENKYGKIHIIEDVLVSGSTVKMVCDFLQANDFQGEVIFHLFLVNRYSLDKLNEPQQYELKFEVFRYMEGLPILQSTCLCLYDLFFERLGQHYYKERLDLLEQFFFKHTDELAAICNWGSDILKNVLKHEIIVRPDYRKW